MECQEIGDIHRGYQCGGLGDIRLGCDVTTYTPDKWVVVKIAGDDPHYRVFGSWLGGYLKGESWRVNSGIVRVEEADDHFIFYGTTGSIYLCPKEKYGMTSYSSKIAESLVNRTAGGRVMEDDTDWLQMDWIISDPNTQYRDAQ